MKRYFYQMKLQTKIVLLICIVFMLVIVVENLNIINIVDNHYYADAENRAQNVAMQASLSPVVIQTLQNPTLEHLAAIQDHTLWLSKLAQVEFIVVIDMQGIRQSHPNTEKIGFHVEGPDTEDVLFGKTYTSTAQGTLGASLRAFQPVYAHGEQIGAVIVGIMSEKMDLSIAKRNEPIFFSMLVVLFICIGLAMMLSRSIKTVLHNLEPAQIAKLLEERNAILRTVREGIITINKDGYVTLINKEARRILKIPEQKWDDYALVMKHKIYEYIPNTRLDEVIKSGESEYDCEQKINDAVILTSRTPLVVNGQIIGAIAAFRDMTEVRELAEKLTGVSRYVDALRSQSHEFFNKLHVIHGLTYNDKREELLNYLNSLMKTREKEEKQIHEQIRDPVIAGFLGSKFSRAKELGVQLSFFIQGELAPISDEQITHNLVTILGNLIDNALEAVNTVNVKNVDIRFEVKNDTLMLEVSDSGNGINPEDVPRIFQKKYSAKGENRGYGLYLVLATVNELHGQIEVNTELDVGASVMVSIPMKFVYGGGYNEH